MKFKSGILLHLSRILIENHQFFYFQCIKRLYEKTSDDIASNYKMTLCWGFLYGKNKYANSFFFDISSEK
jgi:hypothetical protein